MSHGDSIGRRERGFVELKQITLHFYFDCEHHTLFIYLIIYLYHLMTRRLKVDRIPVGATIVDAVLRQLGDDFVSTVKYYSQF